jgi:hypothetical protein
VQGATRFARVRGVLEKLFKSAHCGQCAGFSGHEAEKLAKLGTIEALDTLKQSLEAHEKRREKAKL